VRTKGPWIVEIVPQPNGDRRVVSYDPLRVVATVHGLTGFIPTAAEVEGNAQLLGASEDLLDVLKALTGESWIAAVADENAPVRRLLVTAHAVIAKAEGRLA
jgi:hypothetical protein